MKLTKTLHRFKTQFLTKLPNEVVQKSIPLFSALAALAVIVWFVGPMLTWGNHAPLAPLEQRIYLILFLFLLGLLKVLVFDFDSITAYQNTDPQTLKALQALENRFQGAVRFMQEKKLNRLPKFLVIGPTHAGKTTLLANAGINYILQRQFKVKDISQIPTTENFDWWVTRNACMIDVPGKFLSQPHPENNKSFNHLLLWKFFLKLMKKNYGKNGISGVIITLPLPEIMKRGDTKTYHVILRNVLHRLFDLQAIFHHDIPCQLVITKCDALSGFKEFFGESSQDEITQAWGIALPQIKAGEKADDVFVSRFNALIKKLNQQLLWRIHQERNPMTRPYIKDFPLQVERLKEITQDFIKKFAAAHLKLSLQGVYLTSALQPEPEPETNIIDETLNTTQRAVQLFKEPTAASRAYFVKQFITHGLAQAPSEQTASAPQNAWVKRTAYAVSASVIGIAALTLGKDFQDGVEQAYAVQNNLTDYQLKIQQIQDPDDHLIKTLTLLDALHGPEETANSKFNLSAVVSFYSQKSRQHALIAYNQALQSILLPEIKTYLGEYLKIPVNKNAENVYGALKAYLMMGDATHFDAAFIRNTMQQILPKSLSPAQSSHLMQHVYTALNSAWKPQILDSNLVQNTRRYFSATPNLQLSYIILKNTDSNNSESPINLGMNANTTTVFTSQQITNQIPLMFTAKAFTNIISQEVSIAAEESLIGNWVLGESFTTSKNPEAINTLPDQLRSTYINNYIDVWESLVANIHLTTPTSLAETDALIINLTANDSPLLQLLQTLHDNTYFEPILSTSPKLQSLGLLADKNKKSQVMLDQVVSSLQTLHQYLQNILSASNEKKAAFDAVSSHMEHRTSTDVITQLFLVAENAPEPIKTWLENIGNNAWHYLMQDAGHYLDFTWNEEVSKMYAAEIADRYPFGANDDVNLITFTKFFGNPGAVIGYYNKYLRPFVDTSAPEWRWKTLNNQKLPLSDDTLRQIQTAMRINKAFFPNGDNKMYVQFALQPYKVSKRVKNIKFYINNKLFVDEQNTRMPHVLTWPSENKINITSVQLTMSNQKIFNRKFDGHWGLFKLVNQTFEGMNGKKEMTLNLSMNEHPVKYLLYMDKNNPFMTVNLKNFHLPQQLTERKS